MLNGFQEVREFVQIGLVAIDRGVLIEYAPLALFDPEILDALCVAVPDHRSEIADEPASAHGCPLNHVEVHAYQPRRRLVFEDDFHHVLHVDLQMAVLATSRGHALRKSEEPEDVVQFMAQFKQNATTQRTRGADRLR